MIKLPCGATITEGHSFSESYVVFEIYSKEAGFAALDDGGYNAKKLTLCIHIDNLPHIAKLVKSLLPKNRANGAPNDLP